MTTITQSTEKHVFFLVSIALAKIEGSIFLVFQNVYFDVFLHVHMTKRAMYDAKIEEKLHFSPCQNFHCTLQDF